MEVMKLYKEEQVRVLGYVSLFTLFYPEKMYFIIMYHNIKTVEISKFARKRH